MNTKKHKSPYTLSFWDRKFAVVQSKKNKPAKEIC